jgi:signal transduction histidine kinase
LSESGGFGLGLYLSKRIIEAHHGKIWAENNKGGRGATFSFSLPIRS